MVALGLLSCCFIALVHAIVEKNPALRWPGSAVLKQVATVYTAAYALASGVGCIWAACVVLPVLPACTLPDSYAVNLVLKLYFYSKLLEVMDLLLVTARGFPISIHFRVHHYTTALFAYLGWVSRSSHGACFMLLNLFMHAMVYTFHAGWQPQLLKDCIRGWQHVQLLGGTALAAASLIYCAHPFLTDVLADAVPPVLYLTYYYLFQQELAEEARKNGSTRKEK